MSLPPCRSKFLSPTQTYSYDEVGNVTEMDHVVAGSAGTYDWSRAYAYADASNRLDATTFTAGSASPVTEAFAHDDRGSVVYLPGQKFSPSSTLDPNIETDFRDQIVKVHLATSGHYAVYWQDGGGQRVRKLVVKGGTIEERRYVGPYEVWTKNTTTSGDPSERTTLHVMDGTGRIAMRETLTKKGGAAVTPEVTVRYQLGDHLGTATVELDGSGNLLSYEEFHPYGSTAWQAPELTTISLKRYKFTGMERDEETGLQRHGVRYYATWLGRWTSADPIGLGDGGNRYCYCHGGPLTHVDDGGLQAAASTMSVGPDPALTFRVRAARELASELGVTAFDLRALDAALYQGSITPSETFASRADFEADPAVARAAAVKVPLPDGSYAKLEVQALHSYGRGFLFPPDPEDDSVMHESSHAAFAAAQHSALDLVLGQPLDEYTAARVEYVVAALEEYSAKKAFFLATDMPDERKAEALALLREEYGEAVSEETLHRRAMDHGSVKWAFAQLREFLSGMTSTTGALTKRQIDNAIELYRGALSEHRTPTHKEINDSLGEP